MFIEERLDAISRLQTANSQVPLLGREVSLSSAIAPKLPHTQRKVRSPLSKIVTLKYLKLGPK